MPVQSAEQNQDIPLAQLYEAARSGVLPPLAPASPSIPWWERRRRRHAVEEMHKALGARLADAMIAKAQAAEQGTVVNESMYLFGMYDSPQGIKEPTGITFDTLWQMAHHCEPAAAIINRRVQQVVAYCQPPDMRRGMVKRPGFRIKMRIPEQKATPQDKTRMQQLTQFILDCGFSDPPRDERPIQWQPGFDAFMASLVRDRLTYDFVAIRRWAADPDTDPLGRFPIVSFAAVDASKIRKIKRPFLRLQNGVMVTGDWAGYRTNQGEREIRYVKVDNGQPGGSWSDEFTEAELCTAIGNSVTREDRNGYGYGELERCINAITIWILARDYNASRFNNDSLPRGILALLGNMNQIQFEGFKLQWAQTMNPSLGGNRWKNPIIQGSAQQGAAVNWIPIDLSSREMEYHQFMFTVALWLHSIFSIHPDETGYEALSPFRAPLSEASPETKLKYSQDTGFDPLMRWLANIVNREILWVLDPSKRYAFEWVGLTEGDEMADAELWTALLQSGLTTPRRALSERDEPIPEQLEEDPAMDMLGTWAANHELMLQMEQAEQAQKMQEQQAAMDAERQGQEMQFNKLQAFQAQQGQADRINQLTGRQPGQGAPGPQVGQPDTPEVLRKAIGDPWI